jgi:hypothetical protein
MEKLSKIFGNKITYILQLFKCIKYLLLKLFMTIYYIIIMARPAEPINTNLSNDQINNNTLNYLKKDPKKNKILIIGIDNEYQQDIDRFKNSKLYLDPNNRIYGISFTKKTLSTDYIPTFNLDLTKDNDIEYIRKNLTNTFTKVLFDRGTIHHLFPHESTFEKFNALLTSLYSSLTLNGILYIPYHDKLDVLTDVIKATIDKIERPETSNFEKQQNSLQYKKLADDQAIVKYYDYSTYLNYIAYQSIRANHMKPADKKILNYSFENSNIKVANDGYEINNNNFMVFPHVLFCVDKPYFLGKNYQLNYDIINVHNIELLNKLCPKSNVEFVDNSQYKYNKIFLENDTYCQLINYHDPLSIHTYYKITKTSNITQNNNASHLITQLNNFIDKELDTNDKELSKILLQSNITNLVQQTNDNKLQTGLMSIYYKLNTSGIDISNKPQIKQLVKDSLQMFGGGAYSMYHKYMKYKQKYMKLKQQL